MNGFDSLAKSYDYLVWLVFGKALWKAQYHHLKKIPSGSSVLVVGGGTGRILEGIFREAKPQKVFYVDTSARMIEKAQLYLKNKAPQKLENVEFVCMSAVDFQPGESVDVIITPFFLDMFDAEELESIVQQLKRQLKVGGLWLNIDFFVPAKGFVRVYAKVLLWILYRFFRITCGINAKKLPPMEDVLHKNGIDEMEKTYFYKGIIISASYRCVKKERGKPGGSPQAQ